MKNTLSKKILPLIVIALSSTSCTFNHQYSYQVGSGDASSISEETSQSSEETSTSEESSSSSSDSTDESSSNSEDFDISTLEYEDVDNTKMPTQNKTYRVTPKTVSGDSFTVYNVKFDTKGYLAHPTTLTIKKSDYCLTYETVALYYQAFRVAPPNYVTNKSEQGEDLRYLSTYTYGSYTGSNSYTESLGEFNNKNGGKYLELDIKLNSYSLKSRGTGRVVIVVDGIKDYGDEPVCYFTNDHYSTFSEFYNYATGWGPTFKGKGQKTSPRDIPETITPIY